MSGMDRLTDDELEAHARNGFSWEASSMARELLVYRRASQAAPAPSDGLREAVEALSKLTFAIQHNPNCPSPWLIRVPGKSAIIDMKPYGAFGGGDLTVDRLAFGKTLPDAFAALISAPAQEVKS